MLLIAGTGLLALVICVLLGPSIGFSLGAALVVAGLRICAGLRIGLCLCLRLCFRLALARRIAGLLSVDLCRVRLLRLLCTTRLFGAGLFTARLLAQHFLLA